MATARVSFVTPPSTDSGESSLPSPAVAPEPIALSDETTPGELSELKAILDDTTHLVVARERLTLVGQALASNPLSKIFLGTLDEASQSPRNVTVRRIRNFSHRYALNTLTTARFIQVGKDLKHPNVLGLLGFTLTHENKVDQLISPCLINGNIRDFLKQAPVGVAQRLGFVRDMAAGLDYLHSQSPPVWHGNLEPLCILINQSLNAVLTDFGMKNMDLDSLGGPSYRYMSPERVFEDESAMVASDVWSWGCVAFETLTDRRPFYYIPGKGLTLIAIIQRQPPGQPDTLLSLVPDAPKPEYASTLRLLHSYIPLCWEYEPKKRPPMSLLRHQVFMFSLEDDAGDSVVATLEELAHLLIPPERLHIVEHSQLGEGGYGEVVLGTLDEASSTPRDVAVKRLKTVGTRGARVRLAKRLARELNIWAKIKHPNVVELIGYYLDEKYESPLLISTLMTNGNVLDYIERYKPDIERRIAFVKGITAGLACLHNFDPAICHADLKPANVLIDLQMNAVLCDFGLASFVSGPAGLSGLVTTMSLKGTQRYMGPELLMESNCKHNLESDIWAWACTVYQVLTNRIPYAEISGDVQFILAMDRKELPGDIALLLPTDAKVVDSESTLTLRFLSSILPQCWDFDPQSRPSISALLSHLSDTSLQPGAEASGSKDVASGDAQAQQAPTDPPSRQETPFNGDEDIVSGGSEEGTKLAKTPEDPSGNCAEIKSAQEDKQDIPVVTHPEGEVANETNLMVGQPGSAIKADVDGEAQFEEGDPKTPRITSDRSSLKISAQTLSIVILVAVCIASLSANMFLILVLRKVDILPPQYQGAIQATNHERDL